MKINHKLNPTLFSIPKVKFEKLGDKVSEKIIKNIDKPEEYQIICDSLYNNLYTEAILSRHEFFSYALEDSKYNYNQLLVLSTGLDTKTDNIDFLHQKNCFGLDILSKDINKIKTENNILNNIEIIYCDFNKDDYFQTMKLLIKNGFSPEKPTFLIWEGGTFYITKERIEKTLYYFTKNINVIGYAIEFNGHGVINRESNRAGSRFLNYLKSIHQPWKSFYTINELRELNDFLEFTGKIYKFKDFKHFHSLHSKLEDNIFYYLYSKTNNKI